MSHQTFDKLLREAVIDLEKVASKSFDELANTEELVVAYLHHVFIYQKLYSVVTQIAHPQKLLLSRRLFQNFAGNLTDLKVRLLRVDPNLDKTLSDHLQQSGLTMLDLKTDAPLFFSANDAVHHQQISETLKSCTVLPMRPDANAWPDTVFDTNFAVRVLQINERGRQGKVRAKFMKEIQQRSKFQAKLDGEELSGAERSLRAARVVQRAWRSYCGRAKKNALSQSDFIFTTDYEDIVQYQNAISKQATECVNARKRLQQQFNDAYNTATIVIATSLKETDTVKIKQEMMNSFREWVIESKKKTGVFPVLPDEDVWKETAFDFTKWLQNAPTEASEVTEPQPPNPRLRLLESLNEYRKVWQEMDESDNFEQTHDTEMIKQEKRIELRGTVKNEIYQELQIELDSIQQQVTAVKSKGKPAKKSKPKAKGKKEKSRAATAANVPKDARLDDQTLQQIAVYATNGIIRYTKDSSTLSTVMGSFGFGLRGAPLQVSDQVSFFQNLSELFVIPMCLNSQSMPISASCPMSILFFGTTGSGMSTIISALAQSVKATVFCISPSTFEANLKEDPGAISGIFKLAKAVAPAIIYIDDAEAIFCKKPAKGVTLDIKAIKKDFAKNMKSLKPSDRVLICGRSVSVQSAEPALLQSTFETFSIPLHPNHTTRLQLWKTLTVQENSSVENNAIINTVSSLGTVFAQLTDGFSTAEIVDTIKKFGSLVHGRRQHGQSDADASQKLFALLSRRSATPQALKDADYLEWYAKNMVSTANE